MGLPVLTPPSPGLYTLRLSLPSFDASTTSKVVEVKTGPFLTSLNSPQLLSAAYTLESTWLHLITSEPADISLKVVNTGGAVWLANAKGDKGAVHLGWRWFRGDREVLNTSGRESLQYDVFPGQAYEFTARIAPPLEPGEYILELGLVSEHVAWFSEQGVKPVTVAVRVVNPPGDDFEHLLAKQLKAVGDSPHLSIATDRPRYRRGDVLNVTVDLVNSERSRPVDAYLALAWPDGRFSFWDGNGFSLYTSGRCDVLP